MSALAAGCGRRRRLRGFGLLEAIVALVLLSSTGLALFAWINQNLQAASRTQVIEQEARLRLAAQVLVESVNPMQQATGSIELGGLEVTWTAAPLESPRRNASFSAGAPGEWQIGLYRLEVQARDRALGVSVRFEQWQVGTQRAVELTRPLQ